MFYTCIKPKVSQIGCETNLSREPVLKSLSKCVNMIKLSSPSFKAAHPLCFKNIYVRNLNLKAKNYCTDICKKNVFSCMAAKKC